MGLDITAVSHLKHVGPEPEDFDWETNWGFYFKAHAYDGFEYSMRGLVDGHLYQTTTQSDTFGFRAGSYSGYGRFREMLVEHVGTTIPDYWEGHDTSLPFYELVNFADNEGTIGPQAAADLLIDFEKYRESFFAAFDDDWDRDRYDYWLRACKLASAGGLIDFH